MDHVEAEQRGDAEPVPVDREPLQPVDLGGIGDEEQRTGSALREGPLDGGGLGHGAVLRRRRIGVHIGAEGEVLRELPGLFCLRHRGKQFVGPRPNIGFTPSR
jgi:hypothetical protein